MQTHEVKPHPRTKPSTARYRQSPDEEGLFDRLDETVDRYELLTLVKRAGKAAGFSARMIQLLDYYMAYTTTLDWEEGSRPVCFQSLAKTALALGVSERQVQKIEQRLFEVGAITWRDSGNHKRYGCRDERTGRLRFAFGVDLSPLAYLKTELEHKLAVKELYDSAWLETKRQISWYRGQLRGLLDELEASIALNVLPWRVQYDEIAIRIRTHLDLAMLRRLLDAHKRLHAELLQQVEEGTEEGASRDVGKFAHTETTNQPLSDESETGGPAGFRFQGEVVEAPRHQSARELAEGQATESSGLDGHHRAELAGLTHVSTGLVLQAAGPRVLERLPIAAAPPGWREIIDAAHRVSKELGVSQRSWAEASRLLGRQGAAVCIVVLDGALSRRPIGQPPAYFNGMLNKARRGELRLHSSLYGLADAQPDAQAERSPCGERPLAEIAWNPRPAMARCPGDGERRLREDSSEKTGGPPPDPASD